MSRSTPPALSPSPTWAARHPDLAAVLALLLITACWWWAVGCPFILMDDPDFVIDNPVVKQGLTRASIIGAFTSTTGGLWIPLTFVSLALDVSLFGPGPAGMHFTNVLLHVANALLVYLFFSRCTGLRWRSLLVAALFAMHPLRVESVAWAFERKDVLSIFFGLLALHAWRGYVTRNKARWYAATVLLLIVSFLAKPTLVTFPVLLLLLDVWPLDRLARGWRRLLLEKLPLLLPVAAISLSTLYVQHAQKIMARLDALPLSRRLVTAFSAYLLYLRDTVYPRHLAIYYTGLRENPVGLAVLGALVVALVSVIAWRWMRRHGETGRPFFVGWFWFVGTLVPVIGIVQSGSQTRADRYTYFPAIGLMAALVFALPRAWFFVPRRRAWAAGAAGVIIVLLSLATVWRIGLWRDPERLYRDTLANTGPNGIVAAFVAKYEQDRGNLEEAERWYQSSVAADPHLHKSFYNLGTVLVKRDRLLDAYLCFARADQLSPGTPAYENACAWALKRLRDSGVDLPGILPPIPRQEPQ